MKREWITDRDPKKEDDYLVTANGLVYGVHWNEGWNVYNKSRREHEWKDVSAWMPYPDKADAAWKTGTPENDKDYMVVIDDFCLVVHYCDGWNCGRNPDGSIRKVHEITEVKRWMEMPEPWKGDAA